MRKFNGIGPLENRIPIWVAKAEKTEFGCWLWTGAKGKSGYGTVGYQMRMRRVHVLSYEFHKGQIAPGLVIDHLCRNRACFNPDHLEAVTQAENARRARKTHCPKGHAISGGNALVCRRGGGYTYRMCRRCHREYARDWKRGLVGKRANISIEERKK